MATIRAERDVQRGWVKVTVVMKEPTTMTIRLDPNEKDVHVEFKPNGVAAPPMPDVSEIATTIETHRIYLLSSGYVNSHVQPLKIEAIKFLREVVPDYKQTGGLQAVKTWIETPGGAPLPRWFMKDSRIAEQIKTRLAGMGYEVEIREG